MDAAVVQVSKPVWNSRHYDSAPVQPLLITASKLNRETSRALIINCGIEKISWAQNESKEKERCSGSYRQAVGFLVIKDDSISERPG